MGDGLVLLGLTNTTDAVEGAAVQSFSHASAWWMMPYIIVTTVTTWLDAISVVQAPSFISAIFAVGGVGVAWLLMYEGFEISSDLVTGSEGGEGDADGSKFSIGVPALGLNGFAYASAITYTLQFIVLYLYVFKYRGQHKHVWFGWQPKRVFHSGLMCRFIKLSLPMMLQYALNSWTSTIFQLFMSRHSELFAAAYGGAYDGLALLLCSPLLQPSCTTTTCSLATRTHTTGLARPSDCLPVYTQQSHRPTSRREGRSPTRFSWQCPHASATASERATRPERRRPQ
jgi:Na+-driven multidrug efflux pump